MLPFDIDFNQTFSLPLSRALKTAHREAGYLTLFSAVVKASQSSFSLRFKFCRQT